MPSTAAVRRLRGGRGGGGGGDRGHCQQGSIGGRRHEFTPGSRKPLACRLAVAARAHEPSRGPDDGPQPVSDQVHTDAATPLRVHADGRARDCQERAAARWGRRELVSELAESPSRQSLESLKMPSRAESRVALNKTEQLIFECCYCLAG